MHDPGLACLSLWLTMETRWADAFHELMELLNLCSARKCYEIPKPVKITALHVEIWTATACLPRLQGQIDGTLETWTPNAQKVGTMADAMPIVPDFVASDLWGRWHRNPYTLQSVACKYFRSINFSDEALWSNLKSL